MKKIFLLLLTCIITLSNATAQFVKTYSFARSEPGGMDVTRDSGYILASSYLNDPTTRLAVGNLRKTDSKGNTQWARNYQSGNKHIEFKTVKEILNNSGRVNYVAVGKRGLIY